MPMKSAMYLKTVLLLISPAASSFLATEESELPDATSNSIIVVSCGSTGAKYICAT